MEDTAHKGQLTSLAEQLGVARPRQNRGSGTSTEQQGDTPTANGVDDSYERETRSEVQPMDIDSARAGEGMGLGEVPAREVLGMADPTVACR